MLETHTVIIPEKYLRVQRNAAPKTTLMTNLPDTTYYDALAQLIQPIRAADLPTTLEPMQRLLAALGNPQRAYPVIIVAGSTGKGTTAHMLANQHRRAGERVGLYTSPHLHLFRERLVVDATMIDPLTFTRLANEVRVAADRLPHRYSTFELTTALAYLWFARMNVSVAICEVGLGGRYDAVNAAEPDAVYLTPIEREHAAMLGGNIRRIAWHKAGVMRPDRPAYTVPQPDEVMAVLEEEARTIGALLQVYTPPTRVPLLPARLERLVYANRHLILDGGHTPLAAARLRLLIDELRGEERAIVIVGMLSDKDAARYFMPLEAPYIWFNCTAPRTDRALPPALLASRAPRTANYRVIARLEDALGEIAGLPASVVAVTGSLRTVAAAREWLGLLTPNELEEAHRTRALFEGEAYRGKLGDRG